MDTSQVVGTAHLLVKLKVTTTSEVPGLHVKLAHFRKAPYQSIQLVYDDEFEVMCLTYLLFSAV